MFGIDQILSFRSPHREIAVVGWCCLDDLTPVEEVWALCEGVRVPCLTEVPRPDVARFLGSSALENAGFVCRIPLAGSAARVTLVARVANVDHPIGDFPVEWSTASAAPHSGPDYAAWLATHEPRLYWPSEEVGQRLAGLRSKPVVSVILPTFNTHLYHLHRCIDSVMLQHYPHWELCVTDDKSSDDRVRKYLLHAAAREPRIRLAFAEQQGGISAASNRSVADCTGDFIVLLDHDDELHPAALLEVARCLNAYPETDLIYSDEDKIDQVGSRCCPAFKPDFDEDLLCGFDYLGHLIAIRTTVVRQVGGFRSEADGAQDWDLLLRVTSDISRDRVRHVPKPLYHWRMHADSTALSLDAKPYAAQAWNVVLAQHVEPAHCRCGEGLFHGSMRVQRPVPDTTRVSVLTRVCDGPHQRRALNRTRFPCDVRFFEMAFSAVHPADSTASSALMTPEDLESDVTIVVNCGLEAVNHHFLDELTSQALQDGCGVVGGTIVSSGGTVVTAGLACLSDGTHINPFEGLALHEPGYMGQARVVRCVASIAPHVFAFRTSRLRDVNGLAALSEDSLGDLCANLVRSAHSAGLKVLHTPYAIATLRSSTAGYVPKPGDGVPRGLLVNPNLETFPNVTALLRAGIP